MKPFPTGLIPCCKPLLPRASEVAPFLEQIDSTRWYSNFGPLSVRFDAALAEHFQTQAKSVATVANCTVGISLALLAQSPQAGGLCLLPAWTFPATAHAAVAAGLRPYFVDVDPSSWALTPEIARQAAARVGQTVSAVVPVSPFGAPMDASAWESFRQDTDIAVVIDAAAGFDTARATLVPTVVSLHATKIFGVGEGGVVLCHNQDLIDDVQRRSNFGFFGSREARAIGTNAKLSEYHAAVGLAGLRTWPARRERWLDNAGTYATALSKLTELLLQDGFGRSWVSGTFTVQPLRAAAVDVLEQLSARGVEGRRWWGDGCHRHLAFADFGRDDLSTTEILQRHVVSIPLFEDITPAQIAHTVAALADLLEG